MVEKTIELKTIDEEPHTAEIRHISQELHENALDLLPLGVDSHHDQLRDAVGALDRHLEKTPSLVTSELIQEKRDAEYLYDPDVLTRLDPLISATERIQDHEVRIREAKKMIELLGVDDYSAAGEEVFEQRLSAFQDLVDRGADPITARKMLGTAFGLDYFIQTAQSKEQKSTFAKLTTPKYLESSFPFLHAQSDGAKVIENLQYYQKAVDEIALRFDPAIEAGYPPEAASRIIKDFFDTEKSFSVVAQMDAGEIDERFARVMRSNLNAMRVIGDREEQINTLTGLDGQRLTDTLARAIDDDSDILDGKVYQESLDQTIQRLEELKSEFPDEFTALVEAPSFRVFARSPNTLQGFVELARKLAPDSDFFQEKLGLDSTQMYSKLLSWRVENGQYDEELYKRIDILKQKVEKYPELDPVKLAELYIGGRLSDERIAIIEGLLDNDSLEEALQDPFLRSSINDALIKFTHISSEVDVTKDIILARNYADGDESYLADVLDADSRVGDMRPIFHEIAPDALSARDKDGNKINWPSELAETIARHKHDRTFLESLDWYKADGLPYAAFDTVVSFRERGRAAGVVDSPRAIYEWIFSDPERVEEMSAEHLQQYFEKNINVYDDNDEQIQLTSEEIAELIESARELVGEMGDDARIFVNMGLETIQAVDVGGGTLRSTLDSDGDKKEYSQPYFKNRSGVEVALGIRALDEGSHHPIYGSIVFVGDAIPEGATGYGEIALSFKMSADLDESTTYTPEDSFHGPNRLTKQDAQIARVVKTALGKGSIRTSDYVEAQITKDLSFDDVEAVYVINQEQYDALPETLRVKAVIRPVAAVTEPSVYGARRERRMLRQYLEKIGKIKPLQGSEAL